jgi:hypothetical protein
MSKMTAAQAGGQYSDNFSLQRWLAHSGKSRDILLIFIIVFAVLCFRRYDAFFNPQLWSEDGTSVLLGYETNGIKSLVYPIDQYLILLPHLVGVIFGILHVDLLYIPLCYNLSCFVVIFLISVQLWYSANYLNLKYKILYATCFLFVPVGSDMFMNLVNDTGFTYLFTVNFLFVGYKHGNKYLNIFLIILFSFSGPFTLILSPLIVLIIFLDRKKLTPYTITAYAIMLIAAVIALVTSASSNIRHRSTLMINPSFALPPEHLHLLKLVTNNVREVFFLNSHVFSSISPTVIMGVCIIIFVAIMYFVFKSYLKMPYEKKYIFPLVAMLYFGSYIVAFWPNESKLTAFIVSRYYMLPYTCMAWIIILAWDKRIKLWHIGLYLLFFLKHSGNIRSAYYDKHWKQQVLEYYQGRRDTLEINEGGPTWGWKFVLPKRK